MSKQKPTKEKITISIDPDLLKAVDLYVEASKEDGTSRSYVFEQAICLWKTKLEDDFDEQYYAQNAEKLNDTSWKKISTEAAKYVWPK